MRTAKTVQTGQMGRLIRGNFVGFVVLLLKFIEF